mmetsp:Transcript_11015/g.20542  ORF Transcript_11015/g.20542 Transcript_11015/m.20542 type:complete len:83 (-) Transcript_11015:963-1211(-)
MFYKFNVSMYRFGQRWASKYNSYSSKSNNGMTSYVWLVRRGGLDNFASLSFLADRWTIIVSDAASWTGLVRTFSSVSRLMKP